MGSIQFALSGEHAEPVFLTDVLAEPSEEELLVSQQADDEAGETPAIQNGYDDRES